MAEPSASGWSVPAGGGQDIVFVNPSATVDATYDVILIGQGTIT
jgi:hypothetical protein